GGGARAATRPRRLERVRADRKSELALVDDVVVVPVRAKDERRLDSPFLHSSTQRLERRTGVDEHGGSALLVRDDIGVRQPVRMHAPSDEHDGTLPTHLRSGGTEWRGVCSRGRKKKRGSGLWRLNRARNRTRRPDTTTREG